jgi:Mn2+/Fe2+ NRAMP family transporter
MAEVDDASADPAVAAIAIREFPRRGRGVVATAPTAAGTTLVRALPFAVVPLVKFTGDRTIMGDLVSPAWLKILAWVIAAVIIGLNATLLVGML